MTEGQLEPRAIALLVCLRATPLNIYQLAHALGEHEPMPEPKLTRQLIDQCTDNDLVRIITEPGVVYARVWLTEGGATWLRIHGLDARYSPCVSVPSLSWSER